MDAQRHGRVLRIGVTARLIYPAANASGVYTKTLQFLERSVSEWLLAHGTAVFMVPLLAGHDLRALSDRYADTLDGLVLQGGDDVAPGAYGQTARDPAWAGDPARDAHELSLIEAFLAHDKPVLGVCRGAQLLNVAFGGSLYQDIETQADGAGCHVQRSIYDGHRHTIDFVPGSWMAHLHGGISTAEVTSIHHQAVDRLGSGLIVQARSSGDGIVEAFRADRQRFVVGLQWHPEFHEGDQLLSSGPVTLAFLEACRK